MADKSSKEKWIKNIKTGGNLLMHVGSAGLMMPLIQKSRENQSGPMKLCSTGTGAILAVGIGSIAGKIFSKMVDKAVSFWEDVKPQEKKEEAEKNG